MKTINRRELLRSGAGALTLGGFCGSLFNGRVSAADLAAVPVQNDSTAGNGSQKLGELTLKQLRDQYHRDLFDDFLPFMDKHVIDHELGGFMCNALRDGTLVNTNKNSWYLGRGIWVYSRLYNQLGRDPKHLQVARKAVEFVLRDPPRGDELWPAEFDKNGRAIEPEGQLIGGKRVPVGKQIYGDLFIANGLAEYALAAGEPQYWDLAKDILLKCVRIYDRPDYDPAAPQVYLGGEGSLMPGVRLLGVWMLLLRLTSQMLAARDDRQVKEIADRSLNAMFNHHYNPNYDLFNEVLNHDMSRPANEYRDLAYTGHGIESLWMVLYESRRRGDKPLFDKAARLLHRHIEVAWDDVYGGLFRGLKDVDRNDWILDKALWVQEEALIGTLCVVEQTGEKWAEDWFARIFNLVQEKYPLKKHGYPLWDIWPDRKFTFVEHFTRIENFHHPRHLILNSLCLERMMQGQKANAALPL